ncbi:MAG TPA: hypothetical protein VKP65_23895 [Rhodothermales bacterium]|nr:hypothetical protein [Rhodothermales bacterium]
MSTIISNGKTDWPTRGQQLGFTKPLPEKPNLPEAPEAPDLGPPPREDDPKYDVELSTLDKLLSSRRIKKQQAALNRFEKDRSAWNEDRRYAQGVYEQEKKKYDEQTAQLKTRYEEAIADWKRDFEAFLEELVAA